MLRKCSNKMILIAILIFIITPYLFWDKISVPTVINDEIGYLANAANFAGLNWKSILVDVPYYSYGYSFMIFPFFLITKNSNLIYTALIFFNGILLATTFGVLCQCAKLLFPKVKPERRILACFISLFSAEVITYSQYTWAETLLILLAVLIFLNLIYVIKKVSYFNLTILTILCCFIYITHQRTIGYVLMVVLTIFYLYFRKKISRRQMLYILGLLLVTFVFQMVVKGNLRNTLWNVVATNQANDYGGQISKILNLLSIEGFKRFIYCLSGKIYALLISYFLLPGIFIFDGIVLGVKVIKGKEDGDKVENIIYFFLLFALIFAVGICALFFLHPERIDQIVYTRYFDYLMPIVMTMTLLREKDEKKQYICVVGEIVFLVILAYITKRAFRISTTASFISIQTPIMYIFYEYNINLYVAIAIMFIIYIIVKVLWEKQQSFLCNWIVVGVMVFIAVLVGNVVRIGFHNEDGDLNRICIQDVSDKIQESYDNIETFYVLRSEGYLHHFYGGILQTQAMEYHFEYVSDFGFLNDCNTDARMIIWKDQMELLSQYKYLIEYENEKYCLILFENMQN